MKKLVILGLFLLVHAGFAMDNVKKESILEKKEWKEVYDFYQADPGILNQIRDKIGDGVHIDVVLAFWCPDSQANLPPFLKIFDSLSDSRVEIDYYSVGRKSGRYYVDSWKVEKVPTFIFYRNGQEIGRIVENPDSGMAEHILAILF